MRWLAMALCMMSSAVPTALTCECADQAQAGLDNCAEPKHDGADAALNELTSKLCAA
jgi:hypothetical protein